MAEPLIEALKQAREALESVPLRDSKLRADIPAAISAIDAAIASNAAVPAEQSELALFADFEKWLHTKDSNGWSEWEASTTEQQRLMFKGYKVGRASMAAPQAQYKTVEPEGWRQFIVNCSQTAGGMVSGNTLSILAGRLLAAAPVAQTADAAFDPAVRQVKEGM